MIAFSTLPPLFCLLSPRSPQLWLPGGGLLGESCCRDCLLSSVAMSSSSNRAFGHSWWLLESYLLCFWLISAIWAALLWPGPLHRNRYIHYVAILRKRRGAPSGSAGSERIEALRYQRVKKAKKVGINNNNSKARRKTGVPPSQTQQPHTSQVLQPEEALYLRKKKKKLTRQDPYARFSALLYRRPTREDQKAILASMDTADPDHATLLWSPRDYRPHSPQIWAPSTFAQPANVFTSTANTNGLLIFSVMLHLFWMHAIQGFAPVLLPQIQKERSFWADWKENILSYIWSLGFSGSYQTVYSIRVQLPSFLPTDSTIICSRSQGSYRYTSTPPKAQCCYSITTNILTDF